MMQAGRQSFQSLGGRAAASWGSFQSLEGQKLRPKGGGSRPSAKNFYIKQVTIKQVTYIIGT